ncbi:MAG: glycosyltransferase [Candidatus Micrarchaeia archaeon]
MKILHVVPWYEPAWSTGGTAIATTMLCRALAKKGIDLTVYTTDDDGKGGYLKVPLNTEVNLGGVKVYYFHCDFWWKKKRAFNSRGMIRKLRETNKRYDLVHLSSSRVWFEKEIYKFCKHYNIPYIITPHASLMNYWIKEIGNKILKYLYLKFMSQKIIKRASAIHFLCEGERENSQNYIKGKESFIVPNGIDLNEFLNNISDKKHIRQRLNLPQNAFLLLFVGRIHSQKNLDKVILSLKEITDLNPIRNYVLLIIGPVSDSNYYEYIKKLIEKTTLTHRIIFSPPLDRNRLKEFYWASDIMIMPSKVEGISMSVIEALASSLPVIISNRAANYREIEEDKAGIVINPTVEDITKALKTIIENEAFLKQISINARKSAEKRYDINKVADLMIKAYEDVLTGRRSPELKWEKF